MQNRLLGSHCVNEWYLPHKFVDPTVCVHDLINKEARTTNPASYDFNYSAMVMYLKDVLALANSDEYCWIFMPYNVGYDFQTLNYTKLYYQTLYIEVFFQELIYYDINAL